MTISLCLSAGGTVLALAVEAFTLDWTHSVERTMWRESWRVTAAGLAVETAAVTGSGAGMEVPEGAVLRDGAWHYAPDLPPLPRVAFAGVENGAGDWRLCADGICRSVGDLVPSHGGGFVMTPCDRPGRLLAELPPQPPPLPGGQRTAEPGR